MQFIAGYLLTLAAEIIVRRSNSECINLCFIEECCFITYEINFSVIGLALTLAVYVI